MTPQAFGIQTNAILGYLPAAMQAIHLHLPFCGKPTPSAANTLTARLVAVQWDPRAALRSLVYSGRDLQQEIENLQPRPTLSGVWHKVREASDGMQEACDMVQLPWILRQALIVLNRLEVEESSTHFVTNLKAGGLMDVVERYPFTGEAVEHNRRDKRRGRHQGRVTRADDGSPRIEVTWEDPHGGECHDTFSLSPDGNTLTQMTEMRIRGSGRECRYKTVFRRVHGARFA